MVYTFLGAIVVLLVVAACFDLTRFIIPNFISATLVVLFMAAAILLPINEPWWSYPAAAVIVFAVGLVMYRFNILGAGDVKLLTAVALWAGMAQLPYLLIFVAIIGGVLAVLLILLRRLLFLLGASFAPLGRLSLPKVLVTGEPVPYGIAIAAGGIWLSFYLPYLGGLIL